MNLTKYKLEDLLIEISDSEDDNILLDEIINETFFPEENNCNDKVIYLIRNEQLDSEDPKVSEFLKFCLNKGLFDNTFYDWHNSFSIFATKLPKTFEKLSKDGNDIKKRTFITKFKKDFGYSGDINFIYN